MKLISTLGVALTTAVTLVACNDIPILPIGDTVTVIKNERSEELGTNAVDVLWVIDNSGSMAEEQDELGAQFGAFIDEFVAVGADFHLAVITTDVKNEAQAGVFQTGPGNARNVEGVGTCTSPAASVQTCGHDIGPVLAAEDYHMIQGDLSSPIDVERLRTDFVCLATVGDCGDGYEAGLDALNMALSPELLAGKNSGFLRNGAFLGIIFVTDEDDCSVSGTQDIFSDEECYRESDRANLTDVNVFYDRIREAKGIQAEEPNNQILVAGIMGPLAIDENGNEVFGNRVSCSAPGERGEARDGKRYRELLEMFGSSPVEASICAEGFGAPLRMISAEIAANLDHECLGDTRVQQCEDDRDCADGVACNGPYGTRSGPYLCDNYEVFLEITTGLNAPYQTLIGPGPITDIFEENIETEIWIMNEENLPEDIDYRMNYGDDRCSSLISFSFEPGSRPAPGSYYRASYPIDVSIDEEEVEDSE